MSTEVGNSLVDPSVLLEDVHRKPYAKYETLNGLNHTQSGFAIDFKDDLYKLVRRRNFKFGDPVVEEPSGPQLKIDDMEPSDATPFKNQGGKVRDEPGTVEFPGIPIFHHKDGPDTDWVGVGQSQAEGDHPVRPPELMGMIPGFFGGRVHA
jgi:hypothetical protein